MFVVTKQNNSEDKYAYMNLHRRLTSVGRKQREGLNIDDSNIAMSKPLIACVLLRVLLLQPMKYLLVC